MQGEKKSFLIRELTQFFLIPLRPAPPLLIHKTMPSPLSHPLSPHLLLTLSQL